MSVSDCRRPLRIRRPRAPAAWEVRAYLRGRFRDFACGLVVQKASLATISLTARCQFSIKDQIKDFNPADTLPV